jgi:hypothetical protein
MTVFPFRLPDPWMEPGYGVLENRADDESDIGYVLRIGLPQGFMRAEPANPHFYTNRGRK